ncbi:ABC transporter, periplasmic substrate-binding protein, putative [Fulvimarina pelagi HTCC2506]|uniref:ABC transporter, periplasmic substrate-binding protein, putative n=1 Tax=Fulvimarina pelagi HTCC2506 TaxID=314231 RepID=Q0G2U5_9HYPH|nr:ABC transporter substrate-binding protein [Fulvimarina pelagi]EAU42086.1 ABC transporter, periplasmic substrate-binding protein, putative [Fulvimarina pelagi HTCC2506]
MSKSFVLRLAMNGTRSDQPVRTDEAVRVGFLAPLRGDVAAWGLPGLYGARIWAERLNAANGLQIGRHRYDVEIVAADCACDRPSIVESAKALINDQDVKLLMTLGGDMLAPIQNFLTRNKVLTTTLLPSDLSPDTPYLVAPCEVHPIYNVTGVEWLSENRPHLKRAALCAQKDALGLPSVATYRAAFEAAKIDLVKEIFFPVDETDFSGIVSALLKECPDILCWDTAYEPFVHFLTKEAKAQGFEGQILSCTCDNYGHLMHHVGSDFMEGFVFQFPDFDDPALNEPDVNLTHPNAFFDLYNARHPGEWSAVSWEYASILDLWRDAVEQAGTVEPVSVLAAMRWGGSGRHAFGEAEWWGRDLFGIDNALVGRWPVVQIRNGKARIEEFRSVTAWLMRHSGLLEKHMRALGQMWDQRFVRTDLAASETVGSTGRRTEQEH